ncbi:MAG: L,D-transpeptidase family protein [Rhodospirillales bacterium]|nr:L,D-transpeptidase family protein [Rhodospirillales bacterium]
MTLSRNMFAAVMAVGLTISFPSFAIEGFRYGAQVNSYYQEHGVSLLWLSRDGRSQKQTDILLRYLEESWQHGLNPENYHLEDIRNYLASHRNIAPRFFDEMISDAYLRYVRDMTGMRVDPATIEQDGRYWRRSFTPESVLGQAQTPEDLQRFLLSLEQQGPLYDHLKQELIRLVTEPQAGPAQLVLTETDLLRPGDIHRDFVPMLRAYFNIPAQDWGYHVYDDALVKAVLGFQKRNGLKADGIIGPQTLRLLNKSPEEKRQQIIVNMERLRWLPPQKPGKYVLVNIPSATLWAIENEQIVSEMPVIVGRKERPTMSFVSDITGVRFNPTWTVPKTIKKEDFLPLLRKDPQALVQKGIDIKLKNEEGNWVSVDPASVNWQAMSEDDLGTVQMVQGPGPTNPLGRIRVLMPNQYNIYLHDTSSPEYFRASDRMVSSGCVRVKEPEKLADFILAGKPGWTETSTNDLLADGKMTDIFLPQTLPVYLLYLTVWINESGQLTYGPDIYDWDKMMIAELEKEKKLPHFSVKKTGTALAERN